MGVGRALIERAGAIAAAECYRRMAVSSSVGTRAYDRMRGFYDGALYQFRDV